MRKSKIKKIIEENMKKFYVRYGINVHDCKSYFSNKKKIGFMNVINLKVKMKVKQILHIGKINAFL